MPFIKTLEIVLKHFNTKRVHAVAANVRAEQFGVHAHFRGINLEALDLPFGQFGKLLCYQITPRALFVLPQPAAKIVVGAQSRQLVIDIAQTQGKHESQVKTGPFIQLLIRQAEGFLEDQHAYQHVHRRIGPAVILAKQYAEQLFIYVLEDLLPEQIPPFVFICQKRCLLLARNMQNTAKQIRLGGKATPLEHSGDICSRKIPNFVRRPKQLGGFFRGLS